MELKQQIESILFIAGKPLAFKKIATVISQGVKMEDIKQATVELINDYKKQGRGIQIIQTDDKLQMVTHGELSELAQKFTKEELTSELTKPSIETLTIIAYRGPISKIELERIRGINCSLILRNLMLRGLVEEQKDNKKRENYYSITTDFLRHLGVSSVKDLPDYDKLHNNEDIEKFLKGES